MEKIDVGMFYVRVDEYGRFIAGLKDNSAPEAVLPVEAYVNDDPEMGRLDLQHFVDLAKNIN